MDEFLFSCASLFKENDWFWVLNQRFDADLIAPMNVWEEKTNMHGMLDKWWESIYSEKGAAKGVKWLTLNATFSDCMIGYRFWNAFSFIRWSPNAYQGWWFHWDQIIAVINKVRIKANLLCNDQGPHVSLWIEGEQSPCVWMLVKGQGGPMEDRFVFFGEPTN